jgi:D-alanine-D-alanine ligase
MKNKIHLLIVFGGQSSEHSISILSANNVIKAIDRNKYNLILVYIDKQGTWYRIDKDIEINEAVIEKSLRKFHNSYLILKDKQGVLFDIQNKTITKIDVCFPIFHGLNGEDGSFQGLLKLYNIKFVGSDVLGSCINMDKAIEKRLFKEAGIKTAKFIDFKKHE